MRSQSWSGLVAATLGFLVAGTNAQTGGLKDLGSLLKEQKNLTTFYALIQTYPDILLSLPSQNGVTILAPNNDAFEKIPYTALNEAFDQNQTDVITAALQYHILQGSRKSAVLVPGTPAFIPTLLSNTSYTDVTGGQVVTNIKQAGDVTVFVSGLGSRSTLTQADLEFSGGVVQVINALNIIPSNITETTTSFNLSSFQGALYASDKVGNLSSTPDVTIFAPTNEAFQALGSAISSMTVEELSSILDYHVISGSVIYSTGLKNGTSFATANGANLTVMQSGNNVYINSAQLLTTDILLANGVLHTLDNVLNPLAPSAKANPTLATQAPIYASASSVASLPFTSAIPCTESCPVTSTPNGTSTSAGTESTGSSSATTTGLRSSSSSGLAAAMARETDLGAAGLLAMVGGAAAMMI